MGDRAHIILSNGTNLDSGTKIYLYTHWDGYRLHSILASALTRGKSRWDDDAYLSRIIASELFRESDIDGTTGAGLSTHWMEGPSNNDLFVNLNQNTVTRKNKIRSFTDFIEWAGIKSDIS